MMKRYCWIFFLTIAMGLWGTGDIALSQNPSTKIRILDATGVAGIRGIILLVNPGDARKSEAFITNTQGEAIIQGLECEICTISTFDPSGLFASRTTEFSSSSPSFSLVMQAQPLIDTVGDPQAVLIELLIYDFKGEPLAQQNTVIRPLTMTMENNNQLSVQKTNAAGCLTVQLRAGDYVIGALNGDIASEVRFKIATASRQCSEKMVTCIIASPQASRHIKPIKLQLSTSKSF